MDQVNNFRTSVLQSTVYVVALILAAFTPGLALGSFIMRYFIDAVDKPLLLYSMVEFGIAAYGLLLLSLFSLLPSILQTVAAIKIPFLYYFAKFSCIFLLLPVPRTLMGTTFPILARSYLGSSIGKGIGELYSANNLVAVTGSPLAGFILLPNLGVRYTITIGAGVLTLFHSHQAKLKFFAPLMLAVFVGLSYCRNYSLTSMYNGGACGFYNANKLGDQKFFL